MPPKVAGISYEDGVSQRASVQVKRGKIPALLECYHCDGAKLYRKTAKGLELLLDCSDMEFEPIQAPYEGVTKARPRILADPSTAGKVKLGMSKLGERS